ncbi:MAG TPA: lanthionine synthetase LanC family protein [Longimicrobiaceae bacterium]|nr:lanthionine synthetase LanC family protein [Longimicrobiaceae bacterium]
MSRAAAISDRIREQASGPRDGSVVWLARSADPDRTPSAPLGPYLYGGTTGVALFLAALDHVRDRTDNRETVLRALAPVRRKLTELVGDPERARGVRMPVGGLVGLGALVYALVHIGRWIDEPVLIREAHDSTLLLTPERILADDQFDVVRGCAGAVLALLVLDQVTSDPNARGATPLDLANACADHLLDSRVSRDGGPRTWRAAGLPPLTGFAHGAAGIGYALLRLFLRTGAERLRDAALEAFAFEQTLFDPVEDNWWDPRFGRPLQLAAWCYGAPGMALSRLGTPETARGEEAARMLKMTQSLPDAPVDTLCCGNLGRVEILLHAHRVLGGDDLLEAARALAERTLERADTRGDFAVSPPGEEPESELALFCGSSGIGYTLLRLARPAALPSPLCME